MTSKTILSTIVQSCIQTVISSIKEKLNHVPSEGPPDFLRKIEFSDNNYQEMVFNLGKFSASSPCINYHNLQGEFPKIDIESTATPTDDNNFAERLASIVKWPSKCHRAVVKYVVLNFITSTVCVMLEEINKNKVFIEDEIQKLYRNIIDDFIDETCSNEYDQEILRLISNNLKRIISLLSNLIADNTVSLLDEALLVIKSKRNKMDISPFLTMFSEMVLIFKSEKEANEIIDQVYEYFNKKETMKEAEMMLLNVIGYAQNNFQNLNQSEKIQQIKQLCLEYNDPSFFELFTLISTFSSDDNPINRRKLIEKTIKKYLDYGIKTNGYLLSSIIRILYGNYYAPKTILDITHDNYTWISIKNSNDLLFLYNSINENVNLYYNKDAFNEFTNLILQIVCNDFKLLSTFLNTIISESVYDEIKPAIFNILAKIFSKETNFLQKANNVDEKGIQEIKAYAIEKCTKEISDVPVMKLEPYKPLSFTSQLNVFCSPKTKTEKDIHRVLSMDISKLDSWKFNEKIIVKTTLNRWKSMIGAKEDFIYQNKSNQSSDFSVNDIIINNKNPIILALKLVPYLNEPTFLKLICKLIITGSSEISFMAVHILQAIIHLKHDNLVPILKLMYETSINDKLTFKDLFVLLNGYKCILETVDFDNIQLVGLASDEMENILINILIISICSPYFQIRELAFSIVKSCQNLKLITDVFLNNAIMIAKVSQINAIHAIYPNFKGEYGKYIEMSDIACSNFSLIYIFFASAFGENIHKNYPQIESNIYSTLTNILKVNNNLSSFPYFYYNVFSIILAISSKECELDNYFKAIENLEIDNKEIADTGLLSCANNELFEKIFNNFSGKLRPFSFFFKKCSKDCSFIEKQTLNDKFTESFQRSYDAFINKFFEENIINEQIECTQEIPQKTGNCVIDFVSASKTIFESISLKQKKLCGGIFPRKGIYSFSNNPVLLSERNYLFYFKLALLNQFYSKKLRKAFSYLLLIIPIPEKLYKEDSLIKLAGLSLEISSSLYSHYYQVMTQEYINKSIENYNYFYGIASQFVSSDNFLNKLSETLNFEDTTENLNFMTIIYQNLGYLISIAYRYMMSSNIEQRIMAFDFVLNTTATTIFISSSTNDGMNFLNTILSYKDNIEYNFSKFSTSDIFKINDLLASNLQFLSEQFFYQCLKLEKSNFDQGMKFKKLENSTKTEVKEVNNDSIFTIESSSMKKFFVQVIVPWNERFIDREQLNQETENNETSNFYIYDGCLPYYQNFTVYTFLQSLLSLDSLLPLAPPVTTIFEKIFKVSENFLFYITSINFEKPELSDACKEILIFAYTKKPKFVLNHFIKYLSAEHWFYRNVNVNVKMGKLEKLSDYQFIQKILNLDDENEDYVEDCLIDYVEYNDFMKFILQLIICFINEDIEPVKPNMHLILAYCIINYPFFVNEATEIIVNLTKLKLYSKPQQVNAQVNKSRLFDMVGPWLFDVIIKYFTGLNDVSSFLIKWCLICGEPNLASMAIKMFISLHYTVTDEIAECAIKVIFVISKILNEAKSFRNNSKNNFNPNYEATYCYLEQLFILLGNAKPSQLIYHASCNILQCTSQKHERFVSEAINNLLVCKEQIPTYSNLSNFQSLLVLLIHTVYTKETLTKAIELIIYLLTKNAYSILHNNEEIGFKSAFYLVGPFIYSNETTYGLEKTLKDKNMIDAIVNLSKRKDNCIFEFYEAFGNKIILEDIVDFYITVEKQGNVYQSKFVFEIITIFLNNRNLSSDYYALGILANDVNQKKDYELKKSISRLLDSIMKITFGVVKANETIQDIHAFPSIHFEPEINFNNWQPDENLFSTPKSYPPFLLFDLELNQTKTFKEILNLTRSISTTPFSDWDELSFKSKSQIKVIDGTFITTIDPSLTNMIGTYQDHMKKSDEIKKYSEPTNQTLQNESSIVKFISNDKSALYCSIDPIIFIPNNSIIDSIGKTGDNDDFPSVFPF